MLFLQGRVVLFLSIVLRRSSSANSVHYCPNVRSYYRPIFRSSGAQLVAVANKPHTKEGRSILKGRRGQSVWGIKDLQVTFTKEELESRLTKQQYYVTQQKGTERAFTGEYVNVKEDGTFVCVVCGNVLFKTDKKFESGSGWPSFTDVAEKGNVVRIKDTSHGMVRVEVVCTKCGAHLGHVFDDGPKQDTGLRYCINSASLQFKPDS